MGKLAKWLILLRKQLIIGFTISLYILSMYYFFFNPLIVWGLFFSILLFSIFHFFIIEIKKTDISTILFVIIVLILLSLVLLGLDNIFYVVGVILFHLALFFLSWDIYEEVYNRIEISLYKVFTMGLKMYSLIISFTFAVSFLGTYRTFNITCNQIYKTISHISSYTMQYFKVSLPAINKDVKVKDIVENTKKDIQKNNIQFNGLQNLSFKDVFSISFWKNIAVNQIAENKKVLDRNLCEIIVENIKEKYTNPKFQITVLFFMSLLFYPFIRIVLYIFALLNLFAFKLMNLMHLYRFRIVSEDVEVIE